MSDQSPLVLYRRRTIQLMALVAAWAVTAFAPLSLALPIVTGGWRTNKFGMGMSVLAAAFLGGAGAYLLRAAKPEWLNLTLDQEGFTLRRGGHRHHREWTDVTGVQLTRRQTGRTSVPTIMVSFQDHSHIYLDDIYTLPPEELVRVFRSHCDGAGNPWPTLAPEKAMPTRRWKWFTIIFLPLLALSMGIGIWIKIELWHH